MSNMLKGKLASETLSQRQQYVNSMKRFVQEQKESLKNVLSKLDLSEEELLKIKPRQTCPFHKDHVVPESSFKKHVEKCRLLKAGYQRDELASQTQNLDFCYENCNSIMKMELDESQLNKIIWDHCVADGQVYTGHRKLPVSSIDENIYLTQDDRLAIYHHFIKTAQEQGKVIQVDRNDELLTTDWGSLVKKGLLDEKNSQQYGSKLEQLAALRDLKRRRQSYRAKNVHITKKSYTEIIREVIANQIELLTPPSEQRLKNEIPDHTEDPTRERDTEKRQKYNRHGESSAERGYSHDRRSGRDTGYSRERFDRRDDSHSRHKDQSKLPTSPASEHRRERSRNYYGNIKQDKESSYEPSSSYHSSASHSFLKEEQSDFAHEQYPDQVFDARDSTSVEHDISRSANTKARRDRKRSLSVSSESDGSSDSSHASHRKRSKHKKSKHKKKHSKKHKRKD